MASLGISEFSFGYAFLHEQTHANWPTLRAAPILPSLQEEQDYGWDAHLPVRGTDFYYQFKLSDYLFNGNAKYIKNGTYNAPYYRIALHRNENNRQHKKLRALAIRNPNTYYVAPEFNLRRQFDAAFLNRDISNQSRLIPVRRSRNIADDRQHYITFQPGRRRWLQHSEPVESEESYYGGELAKLYAGSKSEWKNINSLFARRLFTRSREAALDLLDHGARATGEDVLVDSVVDPERTILPLLEVDVVKAGRDELLARTAQILSVAFGVTLVLVGSRK